MENAAPKSWFSRNWKWLAGAAGGLALLGCLCVAGIAAVTGLAFAGAEAMIKSSPVYQEALNTVVNDSRAQEMLGTPITAGTVVSGSISDSGRTGEADFSIPVSGPKGSGNVMVVARKVNGEWVISLLQLVMDGTNERLLIIGETP